MLSIRMGKHNSKQSSAISFYPLETGNYCEPCGITSKILEQLLSVIGRPIYTCG